MDDEQILIWQNRDAVGSVNARPADRAPPGVLPIASMSGANDPAWHRSRIQPADAHAGRRRRRCSRRRSDRRSGVPVNRHRDDNAGYWPPSYFTQCTVRAVPDDRAAQLDATGALANPGISAAAARSRRTRQVGNLTNRASHRKPSSARPQLPAWCARRLTGGGPLEDDDELNEAPSTNAPLTFRRYVAPKQLTVIPDDPQPAPDAGAVQVYHGHSFTIGRPRLGYPALLFTELDTNTAFQHLLDDKAALHPAAPAGGQTIAEYRDVSYFDPDVDQVLVAVDVKTLALDTQASASGREAFIRLSATILSVDADLEEPFALQPEHRRANVINFATPTPSAIHDPESRHDAMDAIVLPASRDIRLTVYPVCTEKPARGAYFGFAKTRVDDVLYRLGEQVQFYVREDADDELDLFRPGLESHQLQALYLQPDPPQVNNALTMVRDVVAGSELRQSTLMERLAAQLEVDFKGLTLFGKPGKRIQFGCSNRIRHTLAPDNSSLTFATAQELINHWLCVLSFDVQRDWTWDGLAEAGFTVERTREFKGEAGTLEPETVGQIEWRKTASRVATTKPDRSITRVLFVDAVEPKKDPAKPATAAHPFPNVIDLSYTLTPAFIASVPHAAALREAVTRTVEVPVTTIPTQCRRSSAPATRCHRINAINRLANRRSRALPLARVREADRGPERHLFRPRAGLRARSAAGLSQPRSDARAAGRPGAGDRPRADQGHHPRPRPGQRRHRCDAGDDRRNGGSFRADGQDHADPVPAAASSRAACGVSGAVRLFHLRAAGRPHRGDLVHGAGRASAIRCV